MTVLLAKIDTPAESPGVSKSSRLKFQTKIDYIPSMSGKQYETANAQVEFEDTLYPDAHIFLFQELVEELPDASAVIMPYLYLKAGIKCRKVTGWAAVKSEMKQMHFRDTFKSKHYRELNEYQKKSIL